MSVTKELIERERQQVQTGCYGELHLHREGTFLRAYDWSAWLGCRYLHDFKASKRQFKDINEPVAYIGFPETSLHKWLPEGAEQRVEDEKHLVLRLPQTMLTETPEAMADAYTQWKDALPLTESQGKTRAKSGGDDGDWQRTAASPHTLTAIMQRILAWPIESKSPLESMMFLADVKQQLASLV
ncbi:MAG: hypothetical protein IJT98_07005 [Prevotella sp.]|nr:hypothetical protein [Prevotella sp.]